MCTVNASVTFNTPVPPDRLKPLVATLPYNRGEQKHIKQSVKNATLFQIFKAEENKTEQSRELRRDRDEYFDILRREKQEADALRNFAVTRIQAIYRGWKCRHKKGKGNSYIRRRKRKRIHSQNDMQDELCSLASQLGLPPIEGLSLEARSKSSRRKDKIMNAASFIITRFFCMIVNRKLALIRVEQRKMEIRDKAARIITKAVRYVKVKNFVKRCESYKRENMAVKIQCRARMFQARER
jgi:hypothetical protein